jgi:uncharacterized membrane protein YbhN (UPF0104 family)
MGTTWKGWGWPVLKGVLALAVLAAIAFRFYDDLRQLDRTRLELHPGWLIVSAFFYLPGLLLSAWYWHHLLHVFGQRPRLLATLRGYFLGHLGKFVPGKAWAVLLRAHAVSGPDVRFGIAVITTFYEVLTTMAAGALVAAVIFAIDPPEVPGLDWHPLLAGVLLLIVCGVPLLPGVFNFAVGRMSARFRRVESFRLPPLRPATLLVGLGVTAVGWLFLGLAVWALLTAVLREPPAFSLHVWMRCTGSIGLAYVAGFLVVFLPGGLGARELFLAALLAFAAAERGPIEASVLVLRLVWTTVEVTMGLLLLPLRQSTPRGESVSPANSEDRSEQEAPPLKDSPRGVGLAISLTPDSWPLTPDS